MSKEHVEIIRSAYESFARGDVPAVLANFDPNIEWIEPDVPGIPFAGTHHGPEAVAKGVLGTVPENWDEFSVEAERFLDAGDAVVVISRFRGRAKSGGRLDTRSAQIFELKGNRVVRQQHFTDTVAWLSALG